MSGKLEKARIFVLKETPSGSADSPPTVSPVGEPILVQFNPATLRIERQNNNQGSATTQSQARQHSSSSPATLSLDLQFDTAEGDGDGNPQDVRDKTQQIRQFVEPRADDASSPPPRMRFIWGNFQFDGIVTKVSEELDYFDADGTALRAKLNLSVTEQDPKFERNQSGNGARTATNATEPGGSPIAVGPGSPPSRRPDRTDLAQANESVQQLLRRSGLDPAAWRSAMTGLDSPLGLSAGAEVQLAATGAGTGVGSSAGFAATGGDASLEQALGATRSGAPATPGSAAGTAAARREAGFILSANGGIAAASAAIQTRAAAQATAAARSGFAVPPPSSQSSPAPDAAADQRSRSYGKNVPLRARANPDSLRRAAAEGTINLSPRARAGEIGLAESPSHAPWRSLPVDGTGRTAADQQQRARDAGESTLRFRSRR
ncbi:hypothetical protein ASG92_22265 [Arthrobacter sp. Soil736]|uniref:CIS tube protein n=1 Tax=Arthrobacter sp. Soil736 TaxID=1736395 RepID=UPI0007009134|nr:hypothetical protein [Arthrobacter sp. Soil736]KRE60011.1 hypothetical protein ASG92_22265 [Arthrobacter sp. Soil736]